MPTATTRQTPPNATLDAEAEGRLETALFWLLIEDDKTLNLFWRLAEEHHISAEEIGSLLRVDNAIRWTAGLVQAGAAVLRGRYVEVTEGGIRLAKELKQGFEVYAERMREQTRA